MIFKRTLILNDINSRSSAKKGVLNLEDMNNQLIGTLRLYNIEDYELKNVAIGLNAGKEVLKIPVSFNQGVCHFKTKSNLDLQDRLSCALVDVTELTNPHIIIGGTSTYLQEWATRVEQAFYQDQVPLDKEEMYSLEDDEDIDKTVEKTIKEDQEFEDCSHCTKCKYREAFYKDEIDTLQSSSPDKVDCVNQDDIKQEIEDKKSKSPVNPEQESPETEPQPNIEPDLVKEEIQTMQESQFMDIMPSNEDGNFDDDKNFYDQIKNQIDQLFEQYQREEELERILPNSKWVKVKYENSDNFYVLGLIFDEDQIKYISYGLPASDPNKPPKDLQEYAQWLPLDTNNPQGEGYWLVYQSADSGESIAVEVI